MSEKTISVADQAPDFSRSFFGYDPHEVRTYLKQLSERLAGIQAPINPSDVTEKADREVAKAIDVAVHEITEVLEAARVSARRIREQAERDVSNGNEDAVREAKRIRDKAESDAYSVRKSAWDASTELLESAQSEGARLREAVERDALDIIGEAERKAHRQLAAARRDSDRVRQAAAAESDQMLGSAQVRAKEIIRMAEEEAATILDLSQPDGMTNGEPANGNGAVESGIKSNAAIDETTTLQDASGDGAAPTELMAVRIVYPESSPTNPPEGRGRRLPEVRKGSKPSSERVPTEPSPAWADGTKNVQLVAISPESGGNPGKRYRGEVVARGRGPGAADRDGSEDPVSSLIGANPSDTIKQTAPPDSNGIGTVGAETSNGRSFADELTSLFNELRMREHTETATREAGSAGLASQVAFQDLQLLPVVNRAVRGVKRQLTDMQREQIKMRERDPVGWAPRRADFGPYIVHTLSVMEKEALDCGFSAVQRFTGIRLSPPRWAPNRGESRSFVDDLFDDIVRVHRSSREADAAGLNVADALSREFRRWRTEVVDRRLRFLALRAYHRGLEEGFRGSGLEELVVIVEDCCDDCANLDVGIMAPDDLPALPVHEGCRCTVVAGAPVVASV